MAVEQTVIKQTCNFKNLYLTGCDATLFRTVTQKIRKFSHPFSHPLHWGFVVLGWNALAIGGVLMQIVIGMSLCYKKMNKKFEDNSNSEFTAKL